MKSDITFLLWWQSCFKRPVTTMSAAGILKGSFLWQPKAAGILFPLVYADHKKNTTQNVWCFLHSVLGTSCTSLLFNLSHVLWIFLENKELHTLPTTSISHRFPVIQYQIHVIRYIVAFNNSLLNYCNGRKECFHAIWKMQYIDV